MPRKKGSNRGAHLAHNSASPFMKLPREIRTMIYEFCLVVNGEIVPYAENYERDSTRDFTGDKPTVALLAVSKAVRKEAASVFYGKNVWRITSIAKDLKYPSPDTAASEWYWPKTIWTIHQALFRRVIVYVHRLDVSHELGYRSLSRLARSHPKTTHEARMKWSHERNLRRMKRSWGQKFSRVLEMSNLISVTFDVTNLFCVNGCCRIQLLRDFFIHFVDCWDDELRHGDGEPSGIDKILDAAYVIGYRNRPEAAQCTNMEPLYWPKVNFVIGAEGGSNGSEYEDKVKSEEDDDPDHDSIGYDTECSADPDWREILHEPRR